MKKLMFVVMILALLVIPSAVMAEELEGTVRLVPEHYGTIQAAVDVAEDGDVIKVAQGTYLEQVEIRNLNNLIIKGENATITVPVGGMTGQLVKIVNSENFVFTGFTVDGNNGVGVTPGARNSGGDTDTRFYGIFVVNSSGHIANNMVQDVSWGTGVQQGLGIYVYIDDGVAREMNIRDNVVTNFQKNGITVYGPIQATIHSNIVTGWGDTNVIAQNCMQLGGDPAMTASVANNVISKSNYTGEGWASTGILALWGNDNLRIVKNSISDTMIGVYVYPGSTNCKIINNSGTGNTWDYYSYADDTKVQANKFE